MVQLTVENWDDKMEPRKETRTVDLLGLMWESLTEMPPAVLSAALRVEWKAYHSDKLSEKQRDNLRDSQSVEWWGSTLESLMDLHLVENLAEDLALQTVDYSVWHWVDLKAGTKVEMWAEW
eukprot:gene11689-biopygen2446